MPYISNKNGRREKLQDCEPALTAGELNYQIFFYFKYMCPIDKERIDIPIKQCIDQFLGEKPNYQRYNDMTGCLVLCAKEIKRRLNLNADVLFQIIDEYDKEIAIYENKKIIENGDV